MKLPNEASGDSDAKHKESDSGSTEPAVDVDEDDEIMPPQPTDETEERLKRVKRMISNEASKLEKTINVEFNRSKLYGNEQMYLVLLARSLINAKSDEIKCWPGTGEDQSQQVDLDVTITTGERDKTCGMQLQFVCFRGLVGSSKNRKFIFFKDGLHYRSVILPPPPHSIPYGGVILRNFF